MERFGGGLDMVWGGLEEVWGRFGEGLGELWEEVWGGLGGFPCPPPHLHPVVCGGLMCHDHLVTLVW